MNAIDYTQRARTFDVPTVIRDKNGNKWAGPAVRVHALNHGHALVVATSYGHKVDAHKMPEEVEG